MARRAALLALALAVRPEVRTEVDSAGAVSVAALRAEASALELSEPGPRRARPQTAQRSRGSPRSPPRGSPRGSPRAEARTPSPGREERDLFSRYLPLVAGGVFGVVALGLVACWCYARPSEQEQEPKPKAESEPAAETWWGSSAQQAWDFEGHPPPWSTQAPPSYQQAPPSYQQAPPSYQQAPPSYQQAPPSYQQAPPSYQQAPPSYQQAPPSVGGYATRIPSAAAPAPIPAHVAVPAARGKAANDKGARESRHDKKFDTYEYREAAWDPDSYLPSDDGGRRDAVSALPDIAYVDELARRNPQSNRAGEWWS